MNIKDSEIQKTKKILKDFHSTLEEVSYYCSKTNKIYKAFGLSVINSTAMDRIKGMCDEIQGRLKKDFILKIKIDKNYYHDLRNFIFTDISLFIKQFNNFFNNILIRFKKNYFSKEEWKTGNPLTLLGATFTFLNMQFKSLSNIVNRFFNVGLKEHYELEVIDDTDKIWDTKDMKFAEFPSDINKIKVYARNIMDTCSSDEIKENVILQLQISEFIKNAIRHGNKLDPNKKVKVWHNINNDFVKLIVQDEGEGFKQLEEWNEFNKLRNKFIQEQDLTNVLLFAAYKTTDSQDNDGGNFLFSALEYWDSGVIFNQKRNKIVVIKYFY
ncbi:MAG: hypothetical protein JW827_04485 [Spirochaetes bacterium]|nr:hypothetical protein [Spirochaetota bacterium]